MPIILLTAINTEFSLGFDSHDIDENWMPVQAFMEKPVDLDMLSNKVSELLVKNDLIDRGELGLLH